MKKVLISLWLLAAVFTAAAQNAEYVYTEAAELTLVGKLMPGKTANPYHRVDTSLYHGFTQRENLLVRMSSGMACAFRTNSRSLSILTRYGEMDDPVNTTLISARGYDLYIRKDGKWVWAGSGANSRKNLDQPLTLVSGLDGQEHDCLLYFPTFSEELSIGIGVETGATLAPLENPFRHRIAIWGSSFTQGTSTSRAGMTYPAQFSRATGLQMLSLGCSGRCMLQDYFADVLEDVDADAFVFDTFSNPKAPMIRERLVPFIDRMVAAHPGKPLVFQQTIYREKRNFDGAIRSQEEDKVEAAAQIFRELKATREGREKYKDVYFIVPEACPPSHEATVDGTHPDNYGYSLWEKSIEKPLLKIFRKYGIR